MSLSRRFGFVVGGTFGGAIGTSRAINFLSAQGEELLRTARARWREGVGSVCGSGNKSPFSANAIGSVRPVKLRART